MTCVSVYYLLLCGFVYYLVPVDGELKVKGVNLFYLGTKPGKYPCNGHAISSWSHTVLQLRSPLRSHSEREALTALVRGWVTCL